MQSTQLPPQVPAESTLTEARRDFISFRVKIDDAGIKVHLSLDVSPHHDFEAAVQIVQQHAETFRQAVDRAIAPRFPEHWRQKGYGETMPDQVVTMTDAVAPVVSPDG